MVAVTGISYTPQVRNHSGHVPASRRLMRSRSTRFFHRIDKAFADRTARKARWAASAVAYLANPLPLPTRYRSWYQPAIAVLDKIGSALSKLTKSDRAATKAEKAQIRALQSKRDAVERWGVRGDRGMHPRRGESSETGSR